MSDLFTIIVQEPVDQSVTSPFKSSTKTSKLSIKRPFSFGQSRSSFRQSIGLDQTKQSNRDQQRPTSINFSDEFTLFEADQSISFPPTSTPFVPTFMDSSASMDFNPSFPSTSDFSPSFPSADDSFTPSFDPSFPTSTFTPSATTNSTTASSSKNDGFSDAFTPSLPSDFQW